MSNLFEAVDHYINGLFAPEDDVLKNILRSTEEHHIPPIHISANQGKFLQVMAKSCNATRILELGTLAAYSTIWLARALPPEGKLITIESDTLHAQVARKNIARSEVADMIELKEGNAADILKKMIGDKEESFDLIFIDADKPPYCTYFELSLLLSHPGTLIIADNVIRDGKVLEENSEDDKVIGVQRFNKMLASSTAVTSTVFQTVGTKDHDGMAIAVVI